MAPEREGYKMPTPKHKPTELSRKLVAALVGYGLKHEVVAKHPDVACGITTLHKYYRDELDAGNAKAMGLIGEALFDEAVTKRNPACLIFLAKTRLGLQEVTRVENTGADGKPIDMKITYRMVGDKAKP